MKFEKFSKRIRPITKLLSVGLIGFSSLVVVDAHKASAEQMATLTIIDVKAISTSDATDAGTKVLFGALGALGFAAVTAATGGAAALITGTALAGAAGTAATGQSLTRVIPGSDDDLAIRVHGGGASNLPGLWWNEEGRSIGSQETLQVNESWDFDLDIGTRITLFDYDVVSSSDELGYADINSNLVSLPFRQQITLANASEGSVYLVNIRVDAK